MARSHHVNNLHENEKLGRDPLHIRPCGETLVSPWTRSTAGTAFGPVGNRGGESFDRTARSDSMFALISENPKIIMMYLLIGAMIVLSHLGRTARERNTRE
jgi:hypothetical protein